MEIDVELLKTIVLIAGLVVTATVLVINVLTVRKLRLEIKNLKQKRDDESSILVKASLEDIVRFGSGVAKELEARRSGKRTDAWDGGGAIMSGIATFVFPDFGMVEVSSDMNLTAEEVAKLKRARDVRILLCLVLAGLVSGLAGFERPSIANALMRSFLLVGAAAIVVAGISLVIGKIAR